MKLLVVEDYAPLCSSLLRGLKDAGHTVDAAADGQEGLWFALGHDYDAIVLDVMLPELDGLEVLSRLRAEGRQTHVLLLTLSLSVEPGGWFVAEVGWPLS